MKQKHTITVADMEFNVVSEAPIEEIEKIVGTLNRHIRSILLKSQNCSKTEATVLCALDFCADKLQIKEVLESVLADLEDEKEKNKVMTEKLALLQNNLEKTEKECARLQAENKRLAFNGQVFKEADSHTETKDTSEQSEQNAETANNDPKTSRDRIGSMFDMLTFTDI